MALLLDVADSARSGATWRIEGTTKFAGREKEDTWTETFNMLMQQPDKAYFTQAGGETPTVIVCDGNDAWIYSPRFHRHQRALAAGHRGCSLIVEDWRTLPSKLMSPSLKGTCGADPSIKSSAYLLVRGKSEPPYPSAGTTERSLCIDPKRRQIVWETSKNKAGLRTVIYTKADRDVVFPLSTFTFTPPADSMLTRFDLPGPTDRQYDAAIKYPDLLSREDPKYPAAALGSGTEGTVKLYVQLDERGTVMDIFVLKEMRPDFDEAAVRGVRQWRFSPGVMNNQPIAMGVPVIVNFHAHK
jgi:TonB family protein